MLQYNPQNVSSSILPIFRRTNCVITASAVRSQPAYCTAVYVQRVTIPEAVITQFVLLKMGKILLETY